MATTSGERSGLAAPRGLVWKALPQAVLAVLLLVEIAAFAWAAPHFFSASNFLLVARLNVELGLLALAMTVVVLSGGIDLSVGSLLGLCTVLFGKLWRDAGLPVWMAGGVALAAGAAAGGLNGVLVSVLRIPALIVTLGTFVLFRGLAEGITGGTDSFTNFPPGFLFLGNGRFGPIPTQVAILALAGAGFYLMVHRSTWGRGLTAIGFSPDGARYAGLRVGRLVGGSYVLSGLCAALAGLIYAARTGEARADAGTGYELIAITAVVLGGTSIFGGRATIIGTLLGWFAVAVLENGLTLSRQPRELTGVLTGVLLLVAIGFDWRHWTPRPAAPAPSDGSEEFSMRNSQLAALSAVILIAAFIIAGANLWLVRSMSKHLVAGGGSAAPADGPAASPRAGGKITIGMMPKSKGNAYFIACRKGAEEAARELNVDLIWDGPTTSSPGEQNKIIDTWVAAKVDVIAVAVENRDGLSAALRRARESGIKVITWDADAAPDARDFFVNQATPEGIGTTLMDTAARVMGGKGNFAIITGTLTAANLNEWRKNIEIRLKEKYPDIKLLETVPCDDKQQEAFAQAKLLLNKYRPPEPKLDLIMAVCSPAVPGAAEAVQQSGRVDVGVIGLGLPNENRKYVKEGTTQAVILWKTADLGYLTVYAADAAARGQLKPGADAFNAGRLGKVNVTPQGSILLGEPFIFNKQNIDQFDF